MKSNNYVKLALLMTTITSAFFAPQEAPAKASGDITGYVILAITKKPAAGIQAHHTNRREFTGLVVGPNGKPIPNAEVIGRELNVPPVRTQTTYLGAFDMTLRPGDTILARSGSLGAETITYQGEKKLVIRLKPGKLCAIKGQLTSDDGTPITDATITLFLKGSSNDIGLVSGRTDAKGYYSLVPAYQNETYYVQVESPTHDQLKSPIFFIHPAQTIHTMPLTLSFADSFAGGIVLDPQGNPYYGAVLSRDGNDYGLTSKTDESGRFMMKHLPRNKAHIFIQTGIGNFTQVDLKCGISDNVVRLPEKAMPK